MFFDNEIKAVLQFSEFKNKNRFHFLVALLHPSQVFMCLLADCDKLFEQVTNPYVLRLSRAILDVGLVIVSKADFLFSSV